ncbi:MAG: flagellar basal body-associated FliL family protein [Pseudomonadota bacterium]
MSDTPDNTQEAPAKKSKLPLIIGLVLALVGGGGGFYATFSGLILGSDPNEKAEKTAKGDLPTFDVAYVEVDPLVVSLQSSATARHLKFRAQLEVETAAKEKVEKLLPRVTDVLNSYLRALEPSDLENPASLTRLRAQMLRRVQVVTGGNMVNDLLIMEFVLT